jgi:hypothetical protein
METDLSEMINTQRAIMANVFKKQVHEKKWK